MWDQRYSESGFAYGTAVNEFLKDEFQRIPSGGRVLCLAEGEGRNAVFLAQQGYQVTAIDLSEVGLNKALQLASDKGVKISTQVVDLADYNFSEQYWDGIISISAHMPEAIRKRVHAQIAPALKSGGVFILEAFTYEQTQMEGVGGPPASQKEMFMSLEKLQLELSQLHEATGIEKSRTISEGKFHQGLSAVVQFIGNK
jgi:cyclopropane fatty-acyl-phospholipid synthase-like methyltransferase